MKTKTKIFKICLVLLCTFEICSANVIQFLLKLTESSKYPTRVRTVEERDRKSNESVLDFIGLIERYDGYTAEEYNVTTDDGYILGLHRISGSPSYPKADGKPVVLIQHGLISSSDVMVVLGPNDSLAFQLAKVGYDVWLGNVRGNTYSKNHNKYSSIKDSEYFWDFSMDEIAEYDISKFIDVVLEKTGKKNLTYIGYSMGTTLGFMLLSTKLEYNQKVNLFINLSPVAHFISPVNLLVKTVISTIKGYYFLSRNEVLPQTVSSIEAGKLYCSSGSTTCTMLFRYVVDIKNMDLKAIPQILSYAPAGTSYKVVDHFSQLMNSQGKFQKYDYGLNILGVNNWSKYSQVNPPEYNVSLITAPTAIIYSANDVFINIVDVQYLHEKLKNVVAFQEVSDPMFNHLDFIWSTKARELVYNGVREIMMDNL